MHKRKWSGKKVFEEFYIVIQTLQCTAVFRLFSVYTHFSYFFDGKKIYQPCFQWDVVLPREAELMPFPFLSQKLPTDFHEARCTVSTVLPLPNIALSFISTGPN